MLTAPSHPSPTLDVTLLSFSPPPPRPLPYTRSTVPAVEGGWRELLDKLCLSKQCRLEKTLSHKDMTFLPHVRLCVCVCVCVCCVCVGGGMMCVEGEGGWMTMCREVKFKLTNISLSTPLIFPLLFPLAPRLPVSLLLTRHLSTVCLDTCKSLCWVLIEKQCVF